MVPKALDVPAGPTVNRHRSEETRMPFTYVASSFPSGNQNVARRCNNSRCGGTFYVSHGAQNYRCPHCDFRQ